MTNETTHFQIFYDGKVYNFQSEAEADEWAEKTLRLSRPKRSAFFDGTPHICTHCDEASSYTVCDNCYVTDAYASLDGCKEPDIPETHPPLIIFT